MTLVALALLGAGGAAASPDGLLLGIPGLGGVARVALAAIVLLALANRDAARPVLGFLPIPLLLLLGAPVPGLRALSGPPLLAIAAAGTVLVLAQTRTPTARVLFFPIVLTLYLGVAARVQAQVGPKGDEPHYLMVADSLLRDHDLALEQDYAVGRYRAFHPIDLVPHYRVRGKDGAIYSLHAVGLSLLVLPAYALGGYPGASFFMAVLAALLAWELRGLLRETWSEEERGTAEVVAWCVALSPPLIFYTGLVFTEIPAALIVATALRRGRRAMSLRAAVGLGVAVAFLPWLNVRYALLAGILGLYVLAGRPRRSAALGFLLPALASVVALAAYHHSLYGFFDPRRVYGARPELSLRNVPEALPGLFLDQEFGLLVYAPALVLALPGLVRLGREQRRLAAAGAALLVVVVVTAASWPMWRGGFNPPARFLVPLLPVMAVALAAWLRRGLSAAAALLLGWGLWVGITGASEPRLVHRDRDGTAPFFREMSGAEEWTRLLPPYVLQEPQRHRLALVWAAALGLAAASRRRGVLAAGAAAAGLLAAAGTASAISHSRTEGRDAVRLVGQPVWSVPGLQLIGQAGSRWLPDDLSWGPLYEPHRHPDGAVVGDRLPLPPGRYRLLLEVERLGGEQAAPALDARPEPASAPRSEPCDGTEQGWQATFDVRPGERALTLSVRGGGPFVLRAVNLFRADRSNP
jgi:hypothetical protein